MGKTIGIVSLKGGVGKTSSVVALGDALSSFGKKVLLVDANFSAPNLGIHLNLINPENTLHEVLRGEANISKAVVSLDNFDVLPSAVFNNFEISPLKLRNKLSFLKNKYDYIVIDSSPALNEETLAAMLASDELFVVATPDYPTMAMTLKAIKLAKQRGTKINGLILNKVHGKSFEISSSDVEETLEVPVLAVVPHDLNVLKSLNKFEPLTKGNSEAGEEYRKLAAALIGEEYKPVKVRNFFRWLSPRKQDINRTIFYEGVFN
jgi:septum site-determining protein MinD